MHADFIPKLDGYSNQHRFMFWCQKVLPLVYDDSLSYYELLDKVVHYLNNAIKDISTAESNIGKLYLALTQLQTYVNEYFDNLDVEEEINNIINRMINDGSFQALFGTAKTVEAMQNTVYSADRIITTEGYYTEGDGGDNTYLTSNESVNELSIKSLRSENLYFTPLEVINAKKFDESGSTIQDNDRGTATINILKYGCKKFPPELGQYPPDSTRSDEYDCSDILNTLLSYGLALYVPNGTFICNNPLSAMEISLDLSNNARLLYDGNPNDYFIAINTTTTSKQFITYRSHIVGGIIDTNYKVKYSICANRCVGLLINDVIIQHFLKEGLYLGSIKPDIPEYVIETRVINSTIRNFKQGSFTKSGSNKTYPYPWDTYGIFSGGTDNFFSNLIIQNCQRGVYTGSDDKFTNVHIWQQLGALYNTETSKDYSDYFKETYAFILPPNAVCSFANCTIDNMRTGYYLQDFANVSEFGTMYLFAPTVIDATVINDIVGGLRYVAFANKDGVEDDNKALSTQFHSFGTQFTLPIQTLVTSTIYPLIRLVPDGVIKQLNGANFRLYVKKWNFDGYYPTANMTNIIEYGYNANRTLLNFDGSNINAITKPTALNDLIEVGAYSSPTSYITDYPSDFSGGNITILNIGSGYNVVQVVYHQNFCGYRYVYITSNDNTYTPWRKIYEYATVKVGKYRVACPTEINVYSQANPTSTIRDTIPNGTEFTIISYTAAYDTNWGLYKNESNLNCFVDLSFCKYIGE